MARYHLHWSMNCGGRGVEEEEWRKIFLPIDTFNGQKNLIFFSVFLLVFGEETLEVRGCF